MVMHAGDEHQPALALAVGAVAAATREQPQIGQRNRCDPLLDLGIASSGLSSRPRPAAPAGRGKGSAAPVQALSQALCSAAFIGCCVKARAVPAPRHETESRQGRARQEAPACAVELSHFRGSS
ncbi:MAG: hypothetical protein WDN69_03515 [Aliidongia sp.]